MTGRTARSGREQAGKERAACGFIPARLSDSVWCSTSCLRVATGAACSPASLELRGGSACERRLRRAHRASLGRGAARVPDPHGMCRGSCPSCCARAAVATALLVTRTLGWCARVRTGWGSLLPLGLSPPIRAAICLPCPCFAGLVLTGVAVYLGLVQAWAFSDTLCFSSGTCPAGWSTCEVRGPSTTGDRRKAAAACGMARS